MSRLPSHGFRFGSPPKLHGQEIVQLQLSATVAVTCQLGSAARGGAVNAVTATKNATVRVRIRREWSSRAMLSMQECRPLPHERKEQRQVLTQVVRDQEVLLDVLVALIAKPGGDVRVREEIADLVGRSLNRMGQQSGVLVDDLDRDAADG